MPNFLKLEINPNRIYGLDILRALAIIFVVFGHGKSFYPEAARNTATLLTFDGVSIFFVLSGFLIGGILLKALTGTEKSSLLQFWTRRWMRTLPTYFLILGLVIALTKISGKPLTSSYLAPYFSFTQNFFSHEYFFYSESWSLSVEEWFYILIPVGLYVLIYVFQFNVKESLFFLGVIVIVAVTWFRYNRYFEIPIETIDQWDIHFRRQVSTRMDSLMYGFLAAGMRVYLSNFWNRYRIHFLVLGLMLLVLHQMIQTFYYEGFNLYFCVFSFTLNSLGVVMILPFLSTLKTGHGKMFYFFTYLSLISYSMYLLNYTPIKIWIMEKLPWDSLAHYPFLLGVLQPLLYFFLCFFLSLLLFKYFELPITNLRDRPMKRIVAENPLVPIKNTGTE